MKIKKIKIKKFKPKKKKKKKKLIQFKIEIKKFYPMVFNLFRITSL
jgi:hypothetical protein